MGLEVSIRQNVIKFTKAYYTRKSLVLGVLLQGETIGELGAYIGFIQSIYWILLIYALGFLGIPCIRFCVIQFRNLGVVARNRKREEQAQVLGNPDSELMYKLDYARQFASQKVIGEKDIAYSTEQDLLEQEVERSDQVDREWEQRF